MVESYYPGRRVVGSAVTVLDDLAPTSITEPYSRWWWSWLRRPRTVLQSAFRGTVSYVDLFCGAGGFSLGAYEAILALGLRPRPLLAVDIDPLYLRTYEHNIAPVTLRSSVADIYASPVREPVDLVLASPPCEGHTDLNNHTRRQDERNGLMLEAARVAADVLEAPLVIIENVPAALHNRTDVVGRTVRYFEQVGYKVQQYTVSAVLCGVPQTRKRLFLVASQTQLPPFEPPGIQHDVAWAIGDLPPQEGAALSDANRQRIEYMFKYGLYELPKELRPKCYRYGRLRWDAPAGTITSGFRSPCGGVWVHPSQPRTLTPHEAARLMTFPDGYLFFGQRHKQVAKQIAQAVPPLLAYQVVLHALTNSTANAIMSAL